MPTDPSPWAQAQAREIATDRVGEIAEGSSQQYDGMYPADKLRHDIAVALDAAYARGVAACLRSDPCERRG